MLFRSDHLDLDFPEEYGYFDLDIENYVEQVLLMKEKYKNQIKIYLGIEFGLVPEEGLAKRYEALANKYPFDFILGSVHLVDWVDPYYPDYWEGKTVNQGLLEYFNTILESIKIYNEYDSLGHLDYIIRYTELEDNPKRNQDLLFDNYEYEVHKEVLDEILNHIIKRGKALEVNTAGYKKGLGAPNPQYSVLKRYQEMGGKLITIGSDGHQPDHLAYEFDKTLEFLLAVGFEEFVIYKDRELEVMKL